MFNAKKLSKILVFILLISILLSSLYSFFDFNLILIKKDVPNLSDLSFQSKGAYLEILSADGSTLYKEYHYFGGNVTKGINFDLALNILKLENDEYVIPYQPRLVKFLSRFKDLNNDRNRDFITSYYTEKLLYGKVGEHYRDELLKLYTGEKLNRTFSENQRYEFFLNSFDYADNIRGVEGAAQAYFGKSFNKLTPLEVAYILAKALSKYYSMNLDEVYFDKAARRYLSLLYERGDISLETYRSYLSAPLEIKVTSNIGVYDAIIDNVMLEFSKYVDINNITDKKIVINTYYDTNITRSANDILQDLYKVDPDIRAAFVMVDVSKGAVLTAIGDKYPHSKNNRVFSIKRQTASIFKPIVYLTALENGFSPTDIIEDKRYVFLHDGKEYSPANFGDIYMGKILMRNGLKHSLNNAAVLLLYSLGVEKVMDTALKLGFKGYLPPYPSIAAGSAETTPFNMAQVYTNLANYGKTKSIGFIKDVYIDGERLVLNKEKDGIQVVAETSAYQIMYIMEDIPLTGTGKGAGFLPGTASKTGTSNKSRDLWTAAITPPYVTIIWIGYDDNRSVGEHATGGNTASPVLANIHRNIFGNSTTFFIKPPKGVIFKYVDSRTGDISKKGNSTYVEVFDAIKFNQNKDRR